MKLSIFIVMLLFLLWSSPFLAEGQSSEAHHKVNIEIPEVALLGLVSEEAGAIAPDEAGAPVNLENFDQNKGVWINYSSIIRSQTHRRKVVATVQGQVPDGVLLSVEATEARGAGKGALGKPAGRVYLSNEPVEVISDIGSCFTGKGMNNGHLLSYHLEAESSGTEFKSLSQNQTIVQVVYTLTDLN
ncbi:hypothetical protein SAMN05444274_106111 [Mariniphaga anaerophila]|uniref:Uncharacterized protein n=1 Tax=Mariniphaga anaerophila TaxID=1484053 RepID=A0A1M5CGD0_9BACT|nr:hypothetical protein [Mariniphaga anaerophila]SHF53741.1 hypothetical protein SAMN05444274_106111 [Mariniphaga anaerophila]